MERIPEVSVLMGVYNAGPTLDTTLASILDQQGVELEFIVVNDGSTDGSREILDQRAAADPRLMVIHQDNAGLTVSLQRAVERARGRFLARQDAGGDRSLPGRLAAQAKRLDEVPGAVFATCGHRYVDPENVFLYEEIPDDAGVASGLSTLRVPGVRGIMHASAMFKASAFHAVGGYRAEFSVAQDIDLWLRLHEAGSCVAVPETLYECRFEPGGISGSRHAQQMAFARLAVQCAIARRAGLAEPALHAQDTAAAIDARSSMSRASDYHYFVASCLRKRDPARARAHYLQAWRSTPTRTRALLMAALTW